MRPGIWFLCGAFLAGLAVANGAFAAHGLEARLVKIYEEFPGLLGTRLAQFETGVRYQMYHAFAIMIVGILASRKSTLLMNLAGVSFFFGVLFFSGMLYLLVLLNQPKLGMIVPIGGVGFLVGWFALALGGYGALFEASPPPDADQKK